MNTPVPRNQGLGNLGKRHCARCGNRATQSCPKCGKPLCLDHEFCREHTKREDAKVERFVTEADRARRAAWDEIWAELELGEHYVELRHNSPAAERILCICRGGNCRSVAAAFLLKYKYRRDAISCSIEKNDRYTIRLLSVWADRIFSFTPEAPKIVAAACGHNPQCIAKVTEIDIGEDTYANPLNVELLKRVDMELKKLL